MVIYSDVVMFAPMMKLADMIVQKKNVYTLSFEYISQNKSGPDWIGIKTESLINRNLNLTIIILIVIFTKLSLL